MAVTLVKEDGTGLANANSYEDVAGADQYMENTGRKAQWKAFSSAVRTSALIVATQFMDSYYRCRYLGVRAEATIDTQALEFPRDGLAAPSGAAILSANIPVEILQAAAEYALVAAAGPIQSNPTQSATGRGLSYERKRVEGAVEIEKHYDGSPGGSPLSISQAYPAADLILSRWLKSAIAGGLLLRA